MTERDRKELSPPVRLAFIDDHAAVRIGLRAIFSTMPGFVCVAMAATVPEILIQTTHIDVAVLDIRLGDDSSVKMNVRMLQATGAAVLVYSSGESPHLLREAAAAGVATIVRKSESIDRLITVIRDLAEGHVIDSADWASVLDGDSDFVDARLTKREREVLALYASGEPADRVAQLLFIAPETVLTHIRRIRNKYVKAGRSAPSKVHLHQRAVEDGLV